MSKIDDIIINNKELILEWIEQKRSKTWIAQQLNLSINTLINGLKRNGLIKEDNLIKEKDTFDILLYGISNHLTEEEISILLKTSIENVHNLLIYYNLEKDENISRFSGEKNIESILKEYNYNYKKQYTIQNCRFVNSNKLALFDFAILDNYDNLLYLIEYDGIQHFQPVQYFGGKKTFKENQKRDEYKNNYCKEHNIPLIRIPYYKKDLKLNDIVLETTEFLI